MHRVPSILQRIMARKRKRLTEAKQLSSVEEVKQKASRAAPPRDFHESLAGAPTIAVIAEIKRRSPSKGPLVPDLDPGHLARSYQQGGASAISVLTEEDFFGGSFLDLSDAREHTSLPVLRKDFIFSPYQIFESRAMQADAVLLITACLEADALASLVEITHGLGMSALVEVHTRAEAVMALAAGARIIGINNRDLTTFKTDLSVTETVAPMIPRDRLVVSESGISSASDIQRVKRAGAQAVLVGEALVRAAASPEGAAGHLRGLLNLREEDI